MLNVRLGVKIGLGIKSALELRLHFGTVVMVTMQNGFVTCIELFLYILDLRTVLNIRVGVLYQT